MGEFQDLGVGARAGAGLGNFKKNRGVWRGVAIKKLLKIFLFIFSIYINY